MSNEVEAGSGSVEMDEWGEAYRSSLGVYESFAIRLRELLIHIAEDSRIDVVQVEARAKTLESFLEKIDRKEGKYSDPLNEITDLVGTRIITYYQEDVVEIGKAIEREFCIDDDNSIDKTALLDADQFGYLSVHYVATLNSPRKSLPEWKMFAGLRFEIQIRTALQHAWAAVNHKLDYKSSREAPTEIQRSLFRLSALFEVADNEFSRIRDTSSQIKAKYNSEVSEGNFDIPLNLLSLAAYLEHHPQVQEAEKILRQVLQNGRNHLITRDSPYWSESREHKVRQRLLDALQGVGISGLREFDDFLRTEFPVILDTMPNIARTGKSKYLETKFIYALFISRNVERKLFDHVFTSGWDKYQTLRKQYVKPASR